MSKTITEQTMRPSTDIQLGDWTYRPATKTIALFDVVKKKQGRLRILTHQELLLLEPGDTVILLRTLGDMEIHEAFTLDEEDVYGITDLCNFQKLDMAFALVSLARERQPEKNAIDGLTDRLQDVTRQMEALANEIHKINYHAFQER